MATGVRYSDTDTGNTKRAISDVIYMIDWVEAPLLRILGFAQDNVKKFNLTNWPSTKAEWIEDTMSPFTSTLAENIDGAGEDDWDVAANTGGYYRQGDVLGVFHAATPTVNSETVVVLSVSSDTVTVIQPDGTAPDVAHTSGDELRILSRAMPENSSYTTGHTTTTTQPYNYTQIISQAVEVSRTRQRMSKYGVEDEMDREVAKLFADGGSSGKLAQFLQRTFYYGTRQQRVTSDSGEYGFMGGFETFVSTNKTNLSGAAITRPHIHTKIRQIRTAGGKVTHLVTGAWGMEKIESMYEGNRTYTQDTTLGGSEIMQIMTPHGKVKVVYDWMCPEDRYYFVNADKAGWLPFDEFKRSEMQTNKDGSAVDVVGEFTFALANEKSHGFIYGASTTA